MEKITSKNNQLVKDTKRLFTSSRARKQSSLFVLEGARLCFDVLNSLYTVKTLLITEELYNKYKDKADLLIEKAEQSFFISDEVSKKLTETETPQGVFAVCSFKDIKAEVKGKSVIALDRVQDPANVGAILRSAEALGIETVITCECCDIFSPKALRASMGSALRVNTFDCENLAELLKSLKGEYAVYSSVPDENAKSITEIDFSAKSVCVIGNEANGVSEEVKAVSDALITIPMKGRAESLNASAAASVIIWEMLR
ncbi:MAG: RNA methyltransferase [Eubacterium sp.]|nr:RNA methyltransferase [Eubacterium sp.]